MKVRMTQFGQWMQAFQAVRRIGRPGNIRRAIDLAMENEAKRIHAAILQGLRSGAPGGRPFKPLSPTTRKLRGGSKPLVYTRRLLHSIQITKMQDGSYFVGIDYTKHAESRARGKRLLMAEIAAIHEGTSQPGSETPRPKTTWRHIIRTSRQAGWFRYAKKIGAFKRIPRIGTEIEMVIPSRPFISPVWDKMKSGAVERVSLDIMRYLHLAPSGARRP